MQSKYFALIEPVLFAGCAAQQPPMEPLNTPSGRAELQIDGISQQQAIDGIVEACAKKGLTIESQTSSVVVCSSVVHDFKTNVGINYQYGDGQITAKSQYLATKNGNGVKLMLSSAWMEVAAPTGAIKRVPVMNDRGPGGQEAMASLGRIRDTIQAKGE